MTHATPVVSPAALYLANLSAGSQGMKQPLDVAAQILDAEHDADSYPWHQLTYRDTMAVRQSLIARYKPGPIHRPEWRSTAESYKIRLPWRLSASTMEWS